jgi:uncharacterized protein YgbK (DUF1537 family)
MKPSRIPLAETLNSLPPEWQEDPLPIIEAELIRAREKVVVLDDDPTGTQTVHGVPVLTEWPVEALRAEFENDLPALYLLTNSRSLLLPEAQALNAEIGQNLIRAAELTNRQLVVISRSDSTLRGHFPGEVEALATSLQVDFDAWLIVPFFLEGGRYTIDDVHYVAEGDWLVPAGETPYAQDATFGYRSSNLRLWVEEKTKGLIPSGAVASISIADIRQGGPGRVSERLLALTKGSVCIVNAASMHDLAVFTSGLLATKNHGCRYLYRTAASIVPVRAGIKARSLLAPADLNLPANQGALFVVGSYVPKTTAQVTELLKQPRVEAVEIDVHALLAEKTRMEEIKRVAVSINELLDRGQDVVIFTSRQLVTGVDAEDSLAIGQRISEGLITIVRAITVRPRYILAKGGITSSDVATDGLNVKRAMVMGQILPGVPVWQTGPESRFPDLVYIVFPGNVGGPKALADIQAALWSSTKE